MHGAMARGGRGGNGVTTGGLGGRRPTEGGPGLLDAGSSGDGAPVVVRTTAPRARALGREASGFALVGAVGLAVDIGGYNALVHLGDYSLLDDQPLVAKAASLVAGTTVAYFGNRYWTYRDRPRGRMVREYMVYMALSGVALAISLLCLAFTRYVLGLTSAVADNISANVVGLVLGSLFRFATYRRYVFPQAPPARPA
jgi:putative flippase GtrA